MDGRGIEEGGCGTVLGVVRGMDPVEEDGGRGEAFCALSIRCSVSFPGNVP